MTVPLIDRS